MSFASSNDEDVAPYRHEDSGETIHPKSLHYHLNRGEWEGEDVSGDGSEWKITSPSEKTGVWRKDGTGE